MKRLLLCIGAGLFAATCSRAQTPIQVLEQDLKQAQEQHDAASSQQMVAFISALDTASQSPDAALALYQQAGGEAPDAAPISKHYVYETPTEKAAREARDQQNLTIFGSVAQIHCGLMKNAALLVSRPNAKDVQDQWIAWLKNTAAVYPQLGGKHPLKNVGMKESLIGKFLGFHGWGASDQGAWSVQDIPSLYRQQVLEPLRNPPVPAALDAWNIYMAMIQADDADPDHFTQVTLPALTFDRTADDFAIRPTMDKLQVIDQIIKSNPTSDRLGNWITRAKQMIAVLAGGGTAHSPLPGATPGTSDSGTASVNSVATPGSISSGTTAPAPTASPGASYAGTTAPTPVATPGTSSAGGNSPTPTASPGATSAGTTAPTPTASPGTPSSGGASPTPTATP